ncbi:chymotrypsinogen B isoform X2 [Rhipicephalus microplus]|uniref:chymotrypsinogen B isoform X2 n=1 Tax=Rhipicephalus microplus TaxID=6941 RepID=UPI002376780B
MTMLVMILFVSVIGASAYEFDGVTIKHGKKLIISGQTEGYVLSPGFANGTNYPGNFYGCVEIESTKSKPYVKLYFEDVDLDALNYCGGDKVEIWETLITTSSRKLAFCGSQRPRAWVSHGGKSVKIFFVTDEMLAGRGFRIRFQVTGDNGLCDKDQFQCTNRQCIHLRGICDGVIDCTDGSDEKFCTAAGSGLKNMAVVPCGTPVHLPNRDSEDRVVGGTEATPYSWPWQVSLGNPEYEGIGHFCGGALISSQWVLTAAHCVTKRRVSDIIVTLGVHDLLEVDDVMTRKVETLIPHSEIWWARTFMGLSARGRVGQNHRVIMHDYDIALIKLDVPVNFTDKMRPICLPENDTDSLLHGKCLATGWGQTRGSGSFAKLKQAHMRELPFEDCRKRGGLVFRSIDERYSFCAGDPRGEYGVCHGDSGGPLFCSKHGTSWTVQGVANTILKSTDSGTLCGVGSDSFWSRVSTHLAWIHHTIRVM